jgi:aspartokinase-like uncharacterized kinase
VPPDHLFLKLSGNIVDSKLRRRVILLNLRRVVQITHILHATIVPGGGKRVDELRMIYNRDPGRIAALWSEKSGETLSAEEAAHWLAISIMDQNADLVEDSLGNHTSISVARVYDDIRAHLGDLPMSWDVTSDSITYWLACKKSQASTNLEIVLLKDVDGAFQIDTSPSIFPRRAKRVAGRLVPEITVREGRPEPQLASYPFDAFMFTLVSKYQRPFHVLNYKHLDRLKLFLKDEPGMKMTSVRPGP